MVEIGFCGRLILTGLPGVVDVVLGKLVSTMQVEESKQFQASGRVLPSPRIF
jgi:hypothetical protein